MKMHWHMLTLQCLSVLCDEIIRVLCPASFPQPPLLSLQSGGSVKGHKTNKINNSE
jgi:hypothetical protein